MPISHCRRTPGRRREKLVDLREREKSGKAPGIAELRHRLVDKIESQFPRLAAARTQSDCDELARGWLRRRLDQRECEVRNKRMKILERRSTAYLYEASTGPIRY